MRHVARAVLVVGLLACSSVTFAATLEWTGASDNRWNNAANWNPAQLPQSGDWLRFVNGTNLNSINDLPAGTMLSKLSFFVFPVVHFTVSGSTVDVTTSIDGGNNQVTFNAPVRAMGALSISGTPDFAGSFNVNGNTITLGGAFFHGPVIGTGTIFNMSSSAYFYANSTFSGNFADAHGGGCTANTVLYGDFPSATADLYCSASASGTMGPLTSSASFSPATASSQTAIATTGNLIFSNRGATLDDARPYRVDIGGTAAGAGYDQVKVNGSVQLQNGFLTLSVIGGFAPTAGQTFIIVDNDGGDAVSGNFNSFCFGCNGTTYTEGATITAGGFSFRISYQGGDGNDVVLTAIASSSTSLNTFPNPSTYSQPVTLTATVTGSGPTPTGTVSFKVNGGVIGSAPLVSGVATLTTSAIGGGTHSVTATYGGDTNYGTSTSAPISQTVQPANTTTTLTSSPNPSAVGQNVTFTATATRQGGLGPVSNGTVVTFLDAAAQIGFATTTGGVATLTTSALTAGSHNITARFEGTTSENQSTSNVVVQVVNTSTTTTATAQVTPPGTAPTIAVTVTSSNGTPSGNVTVKNGATTVGSGTLGANGKVSITLDHPLPPGNYTLTVSYAGSGPFAPSSTTVSLTVDVLTVSGDDVATIEGNSGQTIVRINVRLSQAAGQSVTVDYTTADGSAKGDEDYVATSGTLTFAPGETLQRISVTINGDTTPEPDERFFVRFANAHGSVVGRAQITATIQNDDATSTATRDLEFENVGGTSLMLDLFLPVDSRPHPVIVGIDAINWNTPLRQTSVITREAARGYAVAMLSFRPASTTTMTAQIADVKTAIRWLRANAARYDLDPSRIGIWGIGAGGYLAALAGTSNAVGTFDDPALGNVAWPSNVRAVVDWYGVTDLSRLATDSTVCGDTLAQVTQLLGCSATSCPDTARAASPTTYVSRDDPPFLIVHGSTDCNVPLSQSRALYDALRAAGVDATLVVNEGAGHGGMNWDNEALLTAVDDFFDRVLLPLPQRDRRARH
jgi:acetyl esterase/lipase